MTTPRDVLSFWFGTLGDDGFADEAVRKRWFESSRTFDAACRDTFAETLDAVADNKLADWLIEPAGRLAYIVLCDQLPRNIYRGDARAFAWDSYALAAAREGVARGDDLQLALDERCFFYMPFEHSENLVDQHLAVGLFTHVRDSSPKARRELTGNALRYAQQHRDIVLRFGRFPHRNAVLGRASSEAEKEFVAGSDGFGQSA